MSTSAAPLLPPNDARPRGLRRLAPWWRASRNGFTLLALATVATLAWRARADLSALLTGAQFGWLAAAVLLLMAMHVLSGVCLGRGLELSGCALAPGLALRSHVRNLPARYVPGGIWHTVGRMADAYEHGADRRQISAYLLLENALAPAATLLLGVTLAQAGGLLQGPLRPLLLGGALVALLVLLLVPRPFARLRGRAWTRGDSRAYGVLLGLLLGYWVIAASAFFLYFHAFDAGVAETGFVAVGSVYLVGWSAGYLAPFAPQGIGVFEWVVYHGFGGPGATSSLVVLIAGYRLLVLVADMTTWSLGMLAGAWRGRG